MENMGKLRNMASIYLSCEDKMLLLFRQGSRVVNNLWVGSAGGHFEAEEYNDAKACVLRELKEELSVTEDMLSDLQLRYITMRRTKDEIRVNYYFFAELKGGMEMTLSSNEGILKWFASEEITKLQMPFTAKYVFEHYLREGKNNEMIYGGIGDGEKVVFTKMPEF